VVSQLILWWCR